MKSLIKSFSVTAFLLVVTYELSCAQNLLDLNGWTIGQGDAGASLTKNGQASENTREWGQGPHGDRVILWKATPEGSANDDGGWNSAFFPIEHSKTYRFTVWLHKTNSTDGTSYFGCGSVLYLDGSLNDNAYFFSDDLPELNKWYLLVGYIHGSGDASTINYGGIYDGVTGLKVRGLTDFKFAVGATHSNHRSYLYYDPNVNDRQYFYAPRVDLVNGNEPSIASLLGIHSSLSDRTVFSGKVGIKTQDPGNYDLAVNGKVRAQEIKVEALPWPDYVFARDYQLPTLRATEKHIKEKGHLPGIPSAEEVKTNGIEIGEMNAKLLQKIEELTLHLIEQNRKLESQQKEINQLKSKL